MILSPQYEYMVLKTEFYLIIPNLSKNVSPQGYF